MTISRRGVLRAAGFYPIFGTPVPSTVLVNRFRRVSQDELTAAIHDHGTWLSDHTRGKRANFTNCDLRGLDFSPNWSDLTDLRDADFTGADLTGTTGKKVSFLRAGLHGANLSWSRFVQPTFNHASLRSSVCDHAVWGYDDPELSRLTRPNPAEGAAFHHCDFGRAQIREARIRGFFWESSFTSADIRGTDFSYSLFFGLGSFGTSFYSTNLTKAKFCYAALNAVRFDQALLTDTDFTNAEISGLAELSIRKAIARMDG